MHTRKLNEIEYLNWLIGQPYNVSMALTIEGNLNEEKVRKSLEKVQKKHPILQAQLDVNKQGEPYFSWNEIDQVPIDIIPRTDDLLYRKVVAEEFLTPFETGFDCSLPLMRVKLLNGESCSDLIITLPHLICDGMSLMFLFQDILEFIAEPTKKTKPIEIIKNVEEILPSSFQKKIPKTAIKFKILVWFVKKIMLLGKVKRKLKKKWKNQKKLVSNNEKRQFLTREWVLTEDQSQVLFKKCEENGVTVHS
ncbi:MAG: condensation domain-containing protein, partial [Promethearchaeota archaeon]